MRKWTTELEENMKKSVADTLYRLGHVGTQDASAIARHVVTGIKLVLDPEPEQLPAVLANRIQAYSDIQISPDGMRALEQLVAIAERASKP